MLIKFFKKSVTLTVFLTMTPILAKAQPKVENSSPVHSYDLFRLVEAWGEATTPGHFNFNVYGCSRPHYSTAHAACDTAIGVVKGGEADIFFDAIEDVLFSKDLGDASIVPAALISCDSHPNIRCTISLDYPFGDSPRS